MRLLPFFAAAAFALSPSVASAQERDQTFEGGPFDGIVFGPMVRTASGEHVIGLKHSVPDASPVPSAISEKVKGLLRAYAAKDDGAFRAILSSKAKAEFCKEGLGGTCVSTRPSVSMHFAEHCEHNTPYFMGKGEVRIEWLCNGELWYISFLDFAGDKISHIRTLVAEVPPMVKPSNIMSKPNG